MTLIFIVLRLPTSTVYTITINTQNLFKVLQDCGTRSDINKQTNNYVKTKETLNIDVLKYIHCVGWKFVGHYLGGAMNHIGK